MTPRIGEPVVRGPTPTLLVAALFLLAIPLGGLLGGLAPTSAVSGTAHSGLGFTGASEVRAATVSLRQGEGPALGHPTALLQSPGGYRWNNATGILSTAPGGRVATMTWDASDGYVLLYGWLTVGGFLGDTWSFSNGTWTNLTATVTGTPAVGVTNAYAMIAYDPSTAKVVMELPEFNGTWTYHAKTWTNITATAGPHPPKLTMASMATDSTDGEVMLTGGMNSMTGAFNTAIWVFKNGAWANISALSPFNFGSIAFPVLSDDPADHGVLAFGISIWGPAVHPATFLFSGGVWTNLTPTAGLEPPMAYLAAMAYLPSISAVILSEGVIINSTGQLSNFEATWEYSNHAWTNVTELTGPQPTNGALTAGAVDPVEGVFVQFGGERLFQSPVIYPATFLFSAAPKVTASASRSVVDLGQSVTFTGTSTGVSPMTLGWNFGDSGTGSGTSTSHTYTRTGLFTAVATATDFVGATGTAAVSVEVNPTLSVTANGTPSSGTAGAWESLQSTVAGGTAPFTYAWTLGDGSTSTSGGLGHVYASAGSYAVKVTVTDATGATSSANFTVVVKAAPSTSTGSVSLTSGTGLGLLVGLVIVAIAAIAFLGLWMSARKGRGGPPKAYDAGGSGSMMGSSPPGGAPPGAAGGPPPPPG